MPAILTNRLTWRIVGAILVGLLIWFAGELLAIGSVRPLANDIVRLLLALAPLALVGLFWWLGKRRAAKKNAALVDALAKPSPGAREASEVEAKLLDALAMLRTMKIGKQRAYLYELPWYAIIGPSGAGKTTALLNSGLNFPTAVAGEYRALRGQPNTPDCDWWFTDQAVLIDTAGRYVTQEEQAADAEGWRGFLGLLKKHRPLQPLNGVLVALPAPALAERALLDSHIGHIRARLAEITQTLGQELPIYVLVTKADLLFGFREYFSHGPEGEADQVLGSTAPDPAVEPHLAVGEITAGFDALIDSLGARVVDRVQLEPQLPLRAQLSGLPQQVAALRKPLARLLGALTQRTRFEPAARVRGVYLTSGTQTGNPVDRILMSVGLPPIVSQHSVGTGRSYFLKGLFSDLVIPEAGLAGHNPEAERRSRTAYLGGLAAGGALFVLLIGVWAWGYVRNARLIDGVRGDVTAYDAAGGEPLASLDVLGNAVQRLGAASDFGLGLGQGDRLSSGVNGIYMRDLGQKLAPLLVGLAERRITANAERPTDLYDDLKAYLILGNRAPSGGVGASQHLATWGQNAWAADSTTPDAELQAGSVARHVEAMLNGGFRPVAIDDNRVEFARTILREQNPALRVYGRLKSRALAQGQPLWTARDHAGPQPALFFDPGGAFAPGAGVPRLFTREGYERVFLPMLAEGSARLKEETWVVGDTGERQLSSAQLASLKSDLERLYFDEFLARWNAYLSGLRPRPVQLLRDNMLRLRGGSGPTSPIPPLMRAIIAATDLTPSAGARQAGAAAASRVSSRLGPLGGAAMAGAVPVGAADARANVVAAFEPLRQYVGPPPAAGGAGSGPLDATLSTMAQLANKLTTVGEMGGGDPSAPAALEAKTLIAQLEQESAAIPSPLAAIVRDVAGDASQSLTGERRAQFDQAIGASFGEACGAAIAARYPIARGAAQDISLDDFARFFAPSGGAFARFQQANQGAIDMSGPAWRALPAAQEVGLNQGSVAALQAAQTLGRIFFSLDPSRPQLSYQIVPGSITGAKQVTLRLDGQALSFAPGASAAASVDWPVGGGASIEFERENAKPEIKTWPGPWAAFRLMQAAGVQGQSFGPAADGRLAIGEASFEFKVRTVGVPNPFGSPIMSQIRCPSAS